MNAHRGVPRDGDLDPDVDATAGLLLDHLAGYVATRTLEIGLRHGFFEHIARHTDGVDSAELAREADCDPFYVDVWCRAAHAARLLQTSGSRYVVDHRAEALLLDRDSVLYLGGLAKVIAQPEIFDWFSESLSTGERTWWDRLGPDFIQAVSEVTRPAYIRLVPHGLHLVADLDSAAARRMSVLDLACGAGFGLTRLAGAFPSAHIAGVDGDSYSLDVARARLKEAGLNERVVLRRCALEDFDDVEGFDLVIVNYSMHECRDIARVTRNVRRALRSGGHFVISDFPFPNDLEGLQTSPGTLMSGIQLHEALIGDQLLSAGTFVELLERHEFDAVGSFLLSPMHAVIHGRKPE